MTIVRGLANVLAGLVLGGALVFLIATQVMGYRIASIATDSMVPTLDPGDLIVTQPVSIDAVLNGDIILFQTGVTTPILVAHRVANVVTVNLNVTDSRTGATHTETSKVFRTKGDHNAQVDASPVDATAYRGRLWVTVPGAGGWLSSPLPFALIAVGLGGLWVIVEVVRWIRRDPTARPAPGETP